MIDLTAPVSSGSAALPLDRPSGSEGHTASRARLPALDGVPLHYRAWRPLDRPPAGALLFVHGIASHGAWFAETAAHLADRGIAVYAPDRRGSGLSGGTRGHLASYEQALGDLGLFLTLVTSQHPETPLFLAGSSWAAKLALACAARAQDHLAGLLLLGPGLFPKVDLDLRQKLAVLLLHRTRPEHPLQIPLAPEDYTRNPLYLDYIRRDSYRLLAATSRFFWETGRLDRARDRLAAQLRLPILLQIGEADPIMDAAATCRWLHRLGGANRTAIVYRGASHTLDFESASTVRAYRADLLGWLRRQLRGEASDAR